MASGLVLVVAGAFLLYSNDLRKGPAMQGKTLHASFNSANGLKVGANVDLAGVTIGRVNAITLDPRTQMADVAFTMDRRITLPDDTAVGINAPTMTADNALEIHPGHSRTALPPGGTIRDTQDQLSLEQQVSNYIFGGGSLGQ
ncbi:putative toluene tolerance protein [Gluconobacter morbifer G707]|uniref:Putative toluene tolerance protein n=1 Tax=Gluconobacter morbifer G707 TaxID=1088869 RepID=G6XI69_9PROT|nr:putative toluene tolerance protein [Gluconobacter morbifer G707]